MNNNLINFLKFILSISGFLIFLILKNTDIIFVVLFLICGLQFYQLKINRIASGFSFFNSKVTSTTLLIVFVLFIIYLIIYK